MPLIFHQNMRVYGGGSAARNAVFTNAFTAINAVTGANYWVAGFTEITNPNAPLRAQLSGLAQVLDGGLTGFVVIEAGTSALGLREYIGLAWDPTYVTVQHVGQVLWNSFNRRWVAFDRVPPAPNATVRMPAGQGLGADTRGLAYIGALVGGAPYLFGFMHNVFTLGDRSNAFGNLSTIADNARIAAGGAYTAAEVILGGDFNVQPPAQNRRRPRGLPLYARAALVGGVPVPTTNTNPYDFWMVSDHLLPANRAQVYPQSRVPLGSDHAAVALRR